VNDQMHDAFEALAERGEPRGAAAVEVAALARARQRHRQTRMLASGAVAAIVIAVVAVAAAVVWPTDDGRPARVTTNSPDPVPVRDLDVEMPLATSDGWRPILTVPYGAGVEQLGRDGIWGAEAATFTGDRLFVLDSQKARVTSFTGDGTFVTSWPVRDRRAQFIHSIDGGIVTNGLGGTWVLPDGSTEWTSSSQIDFVHSYSDGERLYDQLGQALRIEAGRPRVEKSSSLRTRTGQRFHFEREGPTIEIRFLDPQPHTTRLHLTVDGAPPKVLLSEIASDGEGNVNVFLWGSEDQGPTRAALIRVRPDGTLASVTAAPSPDAGSVQTGPHVLTADSGSAHVVIQEESGLSVWAPSPGTVPSAVDTALDLARSAGCDHVHEHALPDPSAEGVPIALIGCRIGERQMSVAVYETHAAVESARAQLAASGSCGLRVYGDKWIVATNTSETSALVASRIGGDVASSDC
jgi:hypothetical protein